MRRSLGIMAAAFSLAGLAALAALAARRALRGSGSGSEGAAETLTPIRVQALEAVREVVPSAYPDQKFRTLAPSFKPEDPAWRAGLEAVGVNPDHYTTCGELPRYVGDKIGVHTRGGLSSILTIGEAAALSVGFAMQLRDVGQANGAWTPATGSNRPKPGDFYLLSSDAAGKTIVHTGVIMDATGSTWKTADAGQGGDHVHQRAAYVDRAWDAANITLGGPGGAHYLVGWYDIDKGASPIA